MYTFNVLASDRSRKKNGRESYVSFYTQYGVSSRFLAKRRYFQSTFWSTLYTLISVLGHAFIEKEREHVQAILWRFCNDIYIYVNIYSLDICDRKYRFRIMSISWLKIGPLLARDIASRHSFGKYIFGQMLENERGLCARNSNDKRVDLECSVVDVRRTNATGTVTSSYSTQGENLYYRYLKW